MTFSLSPSALVFGSEQDQMPRLRAFKQRHPQIVISTFGPAEAWQALIPEECGEAVVTRYDLRELLDRLDELTGDRVREGPSGAEA
jgi:hypothetical protein